MELVAGAVAAVVVMVVVVVYREGCRKLGWGLEVCWLVKGWRVRLIFGGVGGLGM